MKKSITYLVACLLSVSASLSLAGGYVGLFVGQTDVDLPAYNNDDSLALVGGYKVNKNLALEFSYIDLGEAKDGFSPEWTLEPEGFNFAVVGIIPIGEKVEIFGKLGVFAWDLKLFEVGFGKLDDDSGTDLSFGVGAAVNFTESFGLVLEYQKFVVSYVDIDNISLGARFSF